MLLRLFRLAIFAAFSALLGCASVIDPTKDWTAEQFYQEAKDQMDSGNWGEAVKTFEKMESRYPYGRYTEQGQLEMAYAQYKDNEPALALAALDRFIRLHPTHPNVDYAYYLKGVVNFHNEKSLVHTLLRYDEDLWDRDTKGARESYNTFKELVERFPNSRYAKDARQRMDYLIDAQARYEVHIAQYYFDRGAYVAAANRCKYAIENYPRTTSIEDALGIQAKSYKVMGLTKLMDDTVRVLRTNFPKSRYLKEIEETKAG